MKSLTVHRCLLSVSIATILLAGCGGLQSPIAAPGMQRAGRERSPQTYAVLHRFGRRDGHLPKAGLIYINGTLYGTTSQGGRANVGTVYSITTGGTEKVLHGFEVRRGAVDGANPAAGLLEINNALYGTTLYGGTSGVGTVFRITTGGREGVRYSFRGRADGAAPYAGPIIANGTLYGTTVEGGSSSCSHGCGTVYSITMKGVEKVLYRFAGGSDGIGPYAGLVYVRGALDGTTEGGGSGSCACGTVFSVTAGGTEKVLYRFRGGTDGAYPYAGLIDLNGTLYGTTSGGGSGSCSGGCGTVFSISRHGKEKVLYRFGGGSDGANPFAGLIAGSDVFYGTTSGGGSSCPGGCGTIFSVTPSGKEKVLYSFAAGSDGAHPYAGLFDDGFTLYGTTEGGGYGYGTVFALTP